MSVDSTIGASPAPSRVGGSGGQPASGAVSRLVEASSDAIRQAARTVRERTGVVGYPTETQYGLAVDPFDRAAMDRLYRIKQR